MSRLNYTKTLRPEEIKPESSLLDRALAFRAALPDPWQMIPLDRDLSPACNVAAYLTKKQTTESVASLFADSRAPHLGVIMGNVSHRLYAIESASDAHHAALCSYVRLVSPQALYAIKYEGKPGGVVLFAAKRPIYPHECPEYRLLGDGHVLPLPDDLVSPVVPVPVPVPVLVEIPALSGAPGLQFVPIPRPSSFAWAIMQGKTSHATPALADSALVRSLSASGLDATEIERRVMLATYPSNLRKMPRAKRQASIAALIGNNVTTPDPRVAEFAVMVRHHRWTGRKGDSQRLIMSALATIAHRVNSLTVTTSRTELSNASTVRHQAISDHLDGLEQMGWIHRDPEKKYAITCRLCSKEDTINGIKDIEVSGFEQSEHLGLVEHHGLGRTAWLIYESLTEPATQPELIERTGKLRMTVTRALTKLESAGAATRNESGQWSRVAGFDHESTAHNLGVRHLGAKRINQHAQQARANRAELQRLGRITPRPSSPDSAPQRL